MGFRALIVLLFLLEVSYSNGLDRLETEKQESPVFRPILLSSGASVLGGLAGGVSGLLLGAGIEKMTGSSCSGSDFCIPAGPVLGVAVAYPLGAALGIHSQRAYNRKRSFVPALLWTLTGIAAGGIGAAATGGQPYAAVPIYLGFAHVFPAVMMNVF